MGGSVMEMDIRVTGQPTIVLGLVDVQVVQNDMQLLGGTICHDAVHEAQELPPASSVVMSGVHQSRRHLQGGKQGGCAVTFIFMTETHARTHRWAAAAIPGHAPAPESPVSRPH